MRLVRIENGEVAEYPFSYGRLFALYPDVSFPRDVMAMPDYDVFEVVLTDAPSTPGKVPVEATPSLIGGVWTQQWSEDDAPRRMVAKWLIVERLTDEQLDRALGLMTNRQQERWRAAAFPDVYVDDPEMLAILAAIGADPAVVLA